MPFHLEADPLQHLRTGLAVLHRGRLIYERYFGALKPHKPHIGMSVTKSFTGVLAGILVAEGRIDPQALVTMADISFNQQVFVKAVDFYRRYLDTTPDDHDARARLGSALTFWKRLDGPEEDAVARLGLSDLLDVPVRYLSTGQRKRASLARLIGQGAQLWLLDEPLNGLDAHAARLAETIAAEHCAAGGICVIASHQPFMLDGMTRLELAEFTA